MNSTRKKFKTKLTRERVRSAWLFMMPMFVALGIVAIYPLFNNIKYSGLQEFAYFSGYK